MKYLFLIILPVILFAATSQKMQETSEITSARAEKMQLISAKFDAALMNCRFSLLKTAAQEVEDLCREAYGIEKGCMRLVINPCVLHKIENGRLALLNSDSSDTQGFRQCHLLNMQKIDWVLAFHVRKESFREIEGRWDMIQRQFSDDIKGAKTQISEEKIKNGVLLSALFYPFGNNIQILTQ
ncbi:MAG: hypothetical protein OXC30_00055 [Alphaproteobacteria bacterium]|nr:hypothetical protein [Alphaproteobacteria bacterium]